MEDDEMDKKSFWTDERKDRLYLFLFSLFVGFIMGFLTYVVHYAVYEPVMELIMKA